jgi:tetratricopeptide (TPR) repeat protein
LDEALESDPDVPATRLHAADYWLTRGKFDDALTHLDAAKKTLQDSPQLDGRIGIVRLFGGDLDDAIEILKDAANDAEIAGFYWYLGWAYRAAGEEKDAERAFKKCLEADAVQLSINPHDPVAAYRTVWARYLIGDLEFVQTALDELDAQGLRTPNRSIVPYLTAGVLASSGETGRALELLGKVLNYNYYSSAYLAADAALLPLRNNPAFRKLVGLDDQS